MLTLDQIEVQPKFPCIYWHEGDYMFSAEEPQHLYIGSRSLSNEYLQHGEWHLLDCSGRVFDIDGWKEIAPFGGWKFWFERLMGYGFSVPLLRNERHLALEEAKRLLLRLAKVRFQGDPDSYILDDIQKALPHATSYLDAIKVASKAT